LVYARVVAIVSILLAIPLGAALAEAHAKLARSEPAAASTLRGAPGEHGSAPFSMRPAGCWRYSDRVHARRRIAVLMLLGVALLGAALVEAHAKLSRSEAAAASTLRSAPVEKGLASTENLEPAFSAAHLLDGERRRVDGAEGKVDGTNAALLRMTLPALGAGSYTVVYRVVSIDSHVTAGELSFTIAR